MPDDSPENATDNAARKVEGKPNWVEVGTLAVLVFTFAAAVYAGCEAKRLADLTENTARRQLRSHVLYEGAKIFNRQQNAVVSVQFKNSSATPAFETTYWWNVKAFGTNDLGKLEFRDTVDDASIDLGGGGIITSDEREIPASDIADARNGKKVIYLWGLIKYRDVFQRCQYARFAFKSGTKIEYDKWTMGLFRGGGTDVSDSHEDNCGNKSKIQYLPPTINIP